MRAVIQRVKKALVSVDNKIISHIDKGLLVLLGISTEDSQSDSDYIIDKIVNLRIFKDAEGKMNNSVASIEGEILIVSQFTLYGDARKGRRPSYSSAANGDDAEKIYNSFIESVGNIYPPDKIKTGKFAAMMEVELINDGPVTILLDSERLF